MNPGHFKTAYNRKMLEETGVYLEVEDVVQASNNFYEDIKPTRLSLNHGERPLPQVPIGEKDDLSSIEEGLCKKSNNHTSIMKVSEAGFIGLVCLIVLGLIALIHGIVTGINTDFDVGNYSSLPAYSTLHTNNTEPATQTMTPYNLEKCTKKINCIQGSKYSSTTEDLKLPTKSIIPVLFAVDNITQNHNKNSGAQERKYSSDSTTTRAQFTANSQSFLDKLLGRTYKTSALLEDSNPDDGQPPLTSKISYNHTVTSTSDDFTWYHKLNRKESPINNDPTTDSTSNTNKIVQTSTIKADGYMETNLGNGYVKQESVLDSTLNILTTQYNQISLNGSAVSEYSNSFIEGSTTPEYSRSSSESLAPRKYSQYLIEDSPTPEHSPSSLDGSATPGYSKYSLEGLGTPEYSQSFLEGLSTLENHHLSLQGSTTPQYIHSLPEGVVTRLQSQSFLDNLSTQTDTRPQLRGRETSRYGLT